MLSYFGYRSEYLSDEGSSMGLEVHFAPFAKRY
jgi:hypothetical protein